jgi:hypothetical protein
MTERATDISARQAALFAGWGLFAMLLFYLFADVVVFSNLIVPNNAAATAANIRASETFFRAGIGSFLMVLLCDVLVAWALYVFLREVNRSLSLLTAWLRLLYAGMLGVALSAYVVVLVLLRGPEYLTVFSPEQLHAQVLLLLNAFADLWAVALIFFGFHILGLGYLTLRSGTVPRLLAVLLIIGGVGYLAEHIGKLLFPEFDLPISMVTGWGELVLMIWLLIWGGKSRSPA